MPSKYLRDSILSEPWLADYEQVTESFPNSLKAKNYATSKLQPQDSEIILPYGLVQNQIYENKFGRMVNRSPSQIENGVITSNLNNYLVDLARNGDPPSWGSLYD